MNKVIWKQALDIVDVQTISIPEGAEVLSCAIQENLPTIWFLLDTDPVPVMKGRTFFICGTGRVFDAYEAPLKFIGTCHDDRLGLVWHIFEMVR